jgi:hypothetical protein
LESQGGNGARRARQPDSQGVKKLGFAANRSGRRHVEFLNCTARKENIASGTQRQLRCGTLQQLPGPAYLPYSKTLIVQARYKIVD